ncbi:endosome/lysosome-associated apoptosis and autophagy regulator 1 isoform X2 [Ambystoma mexicanum]|uniref:endosome/lysosome-associated apoptosis and autophagy regulator 1 isoform X2 n=1 Tax=Ambystoma mexicanum TaxID=8296 RepID=UPI0037E7C45F
MHAGFKTQRRTTASMQARQKYQVPLTLARICRTSKAGTPAAHRHAQHVATPCVSHTAGEEAQGPGGKCCHRPLHRQTQAGHSERSTHKLRELQATSGVLRVAGSACTLSTDRDKQQWAPEHSQDADSRSHAHCDESCHNVPAFLQLRQSSSALRELSHSREALTGTHTIRSVHAVPCHGEPATPKTSHCNPSPHEHRHHSHSLLASPCPHHSKSDISKARQSRPETAHRTNARLDQMDNALSINRSITTDPCQTSASSLGRQHGLPGVLCDSGTTLTVLCIDSAELCHSSPGEPSRLNAPLAQLSHANDPLPEPCHGGPAHLPLRHSRPAPHSIPRELCHTSTALPGLYHGSPALAEPCPGGPSRPRPCHCPPIPEPSHSRPDPAQSDHGCPTPPEAQRQPSAPAHKGRVCLTPQALPPSLPLAPSLSLLPAGARQVAVAAAAAGPGQQLGARSILPGVAAYSKRGTMPGPHHLLLLLLWASSAFYGALGQDLHACKESEYHFEYTECDSTGSRWRVAVPHTPGLCTGLPDPVKGTECTFSCKVGEFLDMKEQSCTPCSEGTYSLGTGVRFDEWDELPHGFANLATNFESDDSLESAGSCNTSTWTPLGEYIASNTDECTATLMYAINLKQPGGVSFEYYYPDSSIAFEFFVQNDQCQPTVEESRWMKATENGWEYHHLDLTRGNNVLYWRTTAFAVGLKPPKPVLLRSISITGVAYTSECFPCKPGTYASKRGSPTCKECPAGSYSGKGATSCQECDKEKYSVAGSSSCIDRPPCTDHDFFYTHTACDQNGETQMMYKWIEPKICTEEAKDAVKLPASGTKTRCPPCNPGFFQTNTSVCEPCLYGSYSNGSVCIPCPVGTEPSLGYEYKWWNTLPENMQTNVLNGFNLQYKGITGWEVAGDYIYTVAGASDNDFIVLSLTVPGFSPPFSLTEDVENKEVGRITFVFETVCTSNCELYFMTGMNYKKKVVVENWNGSKGKQSYTYRIEKNATTTFTWAFQRAASHDTTPKFSNDFARIYSINVTNVLDGVASYCQPCALESSQSESLCSSCPPGNYIDRVTSTCQHCPVNTYLKAHQPYGKQACIPCGPGTTANQIKSLCYSGCHFTVQKGGVNFRYDFSALANSTSFTSGSSFTSKGRKYFHLFKFAMCGNQGKKTSVCVENITDVRGMETSEDFTTTVVSYACQAIIIPSEAMGLKAAVSSQPVSLADRFVGVTADETLDNITSPADLFPPGNSPLSDVIFYYRSNDVTKACPSGRATAIRLRCDPAKVGPGSLYVPSKCMDGTCDGCTFHFLRETADACPLCSSHDYHTIVSSCSHGIQKTTFIWREPRRCHGGVALPEAGVTICKAMDFWLKVGIAVGTCTAMLLVVMTCYFWKKNQKLEYKYSKLMINSSNHDGDLPAADSCAIMEGEDAEDDLIFTSRKSIFGKIKSFSAKRTSDGFDSVPLKSSSGITDMDL